MKELIKVNLLICLSLLISTSILAADRTNEVELVGGPNISKSSLYEIEIIRDITYGKALSHKQWNSYETNEINLLLDVYQPKAFVGKRPVIFLFHGGGFEKGSKDSESVVRSANFFASRGFVAITPSYRLAFQYGTLPDEMYQALKKWPKFLEKDRDAFFAMYPACRDAKAAVRWLYANADSFNVDTNYITSLGYSAGSLISVVLGTTNEEQLRDEISLDYDRTLSSSNLSHSSKIHNISNRWGGPLALDMQRIFFDQYPYDNNDAPMQIIHGTIDTRVPFIEAMRLAFNYHLNEIDSELYPLHWVGHNAEYEKVNGISQDELALDFIFTTQNLDVTSTSNIPH